MGRGFSRGALTMVAGALAITASASLSSCGVDEATSPIPAAAASIERASYSLRFDAERARLIVDGDAGPLVVMPIEAIALVVVDVIDDGENYDPWPLVDESNAWVPPAGLEVRRAERARLLEASPDRLRIELFFAGGERAELSLLAAADGRFEGTLTPSDPSRVAMLRVGVDVDRTEGLYGLGETFDRVEHRGTRRAMQLEVDSLESSNNEAHVPVPLVIGTRGWGLFVESTYPGAFDVAAAIDDRVEATFGTGAASGDGLRFHLLAAGHPLDVTKRYYERTGFPRLPAPWALGPLVWRDENEDQAQLERDLATMRELDLPASGVWIDRPYATAVNTFDFEPARFPDAQGLVAKAHALGYRVGLWHTPYLDESSEATAALRGEAEQRGYFPLEVGLLLNKWGLPIDFTAPGATAWWRSLLANYTALGFEGFKLDYAEDVVPGVFGARNVYRFHDGSDERTMHRGYTLAYHEAYSAMLPVDGGLLLCRAGKWGSQVFGPIIWPGDLDARLVKHREEVTENGETYVAVGGLHASMVAGLGLGPSGFPFYGSDTGGYRHAPPDKETFRRWFEQTALSSVMQIGTSTNDVAWSFDDEALLDSYREYTRLHLRLFPYTWTLAAEIAETGRPIQRPFGLAEPGLGAHPSDEYFYGDALLVAPVTEAGMVAREVVFPEGTWVGFWDGVGLAGPGQGTIAAPLGTLPLFLRSGAVVPMLRPSIDTLAPTTEPDRVDSFATNPGELWVLTSVGASSERTLYDGTRIAQFERVAGARLDVRSGDVFREGVVFEVIGFGAAPPRQVTVDGDPIPRVDTAAIDANDPGWAFESTARGGRLLVAVRGGDHAVLVDR